MLMKKILKVEFEIRIIEKNSTGEQLRKKEEGT